MDVKRQMDAIYGTLEPGAIPWNIETPPALLVQLVESGWVRPCDAVDLGCGAGHYAVWMATLGFHMTGVDLSPKALELARALAARRGVACEFVELDLTTDVSAMAGAFDFAYDWEVLHHVPPRERDRYVANVHRMLHPGGRYLSVCFSEEDQADFPGDGKVRTTRLGTTLFFSSEAELRELFEPWFVIEALGPVEIVGRSGLHHPHRALLIRKG